MTMHVQNKSFCVIVILCHFQFQFKYSKDYIYGNNNYQILLQPMGSYGCSVY